MVTVGVENTSLLCLAPNGTVIAAPRKTYRIDSGFGSVVGVAILLNLGISREIDKHDEKPLSCSVVFYSIKDDISGRGSREGAIV